jgi:hypothetical protein
MGQARVRQLHRLFALPALIVLAAALALPRRDQAAADQHPVNGRPGRHWCHTGLAQLVLQPSWPPPRNVIPQLADLRLDACLELAWLEVRPVGMVGQAC